MDIRRERVLKETEEKTQHLSLLWFIKNYDKVYKNPKISPEQIPKNAAKLYEEIGQSKKRIIQLQKEQDKKDALVRRPPKVGLPPVKHYSKEFLLRGPMYPVDEELKKLIYTGVSHNDEGGKAYLKARSAIPAYKKYYDPPTSSMDYGWAIEERCWRPNKEFARIFEVKRSFFRRNGALTGDDPRRRTPFSSAHKCFEIL